MTGRLDPGSLCEDLQTGAHPTVDESEDGRRGSQRGTGTIFFTAPADVARLFKAVLATVQRRIERRNGRTASESEALDAMLEHCFETRCSALVGRVKPAIRASRSPNGGLHPPYESSARGPDDAWNRTTLCAAHHQRCVHDGIGRIRIRGRAPDGLRFELPLVTYGPGERILHR